MPDPSSSNSPPTPSAVIENAQIYRAFENSIVQRVNDRLNEKLARRRTIYIGAAAIIIAVIMAVSNALSHHTENHPVSSESTSNNVLSSTSMPSGVIENAQIYRAFENSIVQRVNERLDEKLARRWTMYISVAAIIIAVIMAVGGYVGNLVLNLQVNIQVQKQVQKEIERATAQIVQEAEFLPRAATLEIQLRQMAAAVSVDGDKLQRAIDEFGDLHSRFVTPGLSGSGQNGVDPKATSPEASALQIARTREGQLADSFDFLVRILGALKRIEDIEQLREIAPGFALKSATALQSLAQSYGRQVVSAPGAPGSWGEGEADHETFRNYRDWSNRARQNNYPELFYLFEAIIWNLEGRSAADIEEILRDIDGLSDKDGENYEDLLIQLANQDFVRKRSVVSGRIAKRVRDFIVAHKDNSTRVAKVAEEIRKVAEKIRQ